MFVDVLDGCGAKKANVSMNVYFIYKKLTIKCVKQKNTRSTKISSVWQTPYPFSPGEGGKWKGVGKGGNT